MGSKCIGIDIGGTTVKIGIFTTEGQLMEKWEVPTRKENNGNQILPDVAASIEKKLQKMGIDKADVVGAGMGVPGPVLPDGSVEVCVNLGWKNANPQKELSGLLGGMLVRSGNDANVAALGEMWQGGGKGYRDIVMVTLGTGVGGGVIIDEKIIAGRHGLAGEIGHIHVRDEETEYCNCGGRGCLEQVASATGIAREARRVLAADETPSAMRRFEDHISAKNVLDCAKSGDALALQVTETVGRYLGLACAQIALTVDPEAFVIGGGVSRAGQFLIDVIQKYYDNYVAISANKGVLTLAKLGNDAGIYGAAKLVLDYCKREANVSAFQKSGRCIRDASCRIFYVRQVMICSLLENAGTGALFRGPGAGLVNVIAVGGDGVGKHLSIASHVIAVDPLIRNHIAGFVEVIPVIINLAPFALWNIAGGVLVPASQLILVPASCTSRIFRSMGLNVGQGSFIYSKDRGINPFTGLRFPVNAIGADLENIIAGFGNLGRKVIYRDIRLGSAGSTHCFSIPADADGIGAGSVYRIPCGDAGVCPGQIRGRFHLAFPQIFQPYRYGHSGVTVAAGGFAENSAFAFQFEIFALNAGKIIIFFCVQNNYGTGSRGIAHTVRQKRDLSYRVTVIAAFHIQFRPVVCVQTEGQGDLINLFSGINVCRTQCGKQTGCQHKRHDMLCYFQKNPSSFDRS